MLELLLCEESGECYCLQLPAVIANDNVVIKNRWHHATFNLMTIDSTIHWLHSGNNLRVRQLTLILDAALTTAEVFEELNKTLSVVKFFYFMAKI